jgi:hypothetical protein
VEKRSGGWQGTSTTMVRWQGRDDDGLALPVLLSRVVVKYIETY